MKQKKSAAELARMIEGRMTLQASVSVCGKGSEWVVGVAIFGFARGAAANREANEIADNLRNDYQLVED